MWYDATDSSTITFEISDVSGLVFLPSTISGLAMWFDAYDAVTVTTTDGTTVTGWKDKSGNGRNTTIIGNGTAPTYSSNGFIVNGQGYPGIKFNSGQYLATQTFTNLGSVLSSNSTDTTIFIVFNDLNIGGMCNCVYGTNLGDTQYRLFRNANYQTANQNWFGFGSSDFIGGYSYSPSIAPQLYSLVKTPTSGSFYTYGNFQFSANTTNVISATADKRFTIGGNESSYGIYNSYISELIIYNRALTTTERQTVEGYLAWTWGLQGRLPPGHPGLTNPPFPFTSPLSVGPIAWYDAADATTVTVPVQIPLSGLQVWLDGADSSRVITSGSTVTSWNDKSGNGFNMNQLPSTCTNPIRGTPINGSNTVYFDEAAGLQMAAQLSNVTNFYWVGRNAASANGCYFMLGDPDQYDWHPDQYPGGLVLNAQYGCNGIRAASPASIITSDSTATYANTFSNLRWPSTAPVVSLISAAGITGSTTRYRGICFDRNIANRGWCGDLGEVLIYSNALTLSQHQQVEGYLAWKWGLQANLPVSHPYKSAGPVAGSVQKWNDKSGKGYNLSLGSGAIAYGNTALGQSINLSGGYMFSTSLANLQNYALFTVLTSPLAVNNQPAITGRPSNVASYNSTDGFGLYVDSSIPQLRLYGNSGGSNVNTVSGTGVSFVSVLVNNISQYISATPGTFTISSDTKYTYYRFTQNSTVTISSSVAGAPGIFYFAIGGGGGGGGNVGGGGGAGGLQTNISQTGFFVTPSAGQYVQGGAITLSGGGTYSVTVGAGGAGGIGTESAITFGSNGGQTAFTGPNITTITALGGGGGGKEGSPGLDGGGGGGGGNLGTYAGGKGIQGFAGGAGASPPYITGGGGGLGGRGLDAAGLASGNGGPPISFLNVSLGGGGGGGLSANAGHGNNTGGLGGGGGAGNGGTNPGYTPGSGPGDAASANTGSGGGGGASYWSSGGAGGSGIFILVVPISGTVVIPTVALNPVLASYTGAANGVISSWINGNAGTITTTGQNRTTTGQGFSVGGEWTGSAYTNLSAVTNIYEIVVMNTIPTTLQRQQMEGYLAWKWGLQGNLPASHPYKTYTPVGPAPSYTTTNIMNVADKSGYGNFLTSNSISYPTYNASAKGIYFGPSAALSNNFAKVPAGYTVIAVASLSSVPTWYGRLVNVGLTDFTGYLGVDSGSSNFATLAGNGTSWASGSGAISNTPVTGVPTYPTMSLLEMNVCGSTLTPYFNGSGMNTKAGTTVATQGLQLGGLGNIQNWPGYLHEFLLVSQQLQPLQRQQLEGYLAWKWNLSSQLPTGHMFKNISPIQATISSAIQPSFTTSNVINWADKSGYGNFLTSNSISYPTYVSSAKGIFFGPNAALSNPFVKIPAGYSAFAIASLSSKPPDYGRLVNIGTTDYNGYIGTYSNSSNYQTFIGTGSAWNAPFPSAPSPAVAVATYPQLSMLELTFSGGTTYTPYVNGTNLSGISSTSAQSSVTGINFGQLPPGSTQPWTGYLHEFLLVSQLLNPIQRQQVEGYLAWKWNISSQLPTGHPFRTVSPVQGYIPTSNVRGFIDKSGFGNNFSLVSPITNYPQYSSTYKGVYLGISASFLNTTLSVPTGYTMMAVASLSTAPGSYGRLINVGTGDNIGFMGTYSGTNNFATFTGNGNWNDITANTPATPVSTNPVLPSILEMTVCGTVLNPFFNAADMSAKVGTTVATTGMIIGATANNGGQFWPGYLNEFLLVPRTLTILQRQQLEGYLAWKWGLQGNLPSTHPFASAAP